MNSQFDELAKGVAQSVTRRQALRRFGASLAGAVLASVGAANSVEAQRSHKRCLCKKPPYYGCDPSDYICHINCTSACSG